MRPAFYRNLMGEIMNKNFTKLCMVLGTSAVALASASVQAQDTAGQTDGTTAQSEPEPEDIIVVTGTQIRGAQVDDVLPVTVLGEKNIEAIDPASGDEREDELFRLGGCLIDLHAVGNADANPELPRAVVGNDPQSTPDLSAQ